MIRYFVRGIYSDAKTGKVRNFGFIVHGKNSNAVSEDAIKVMKAGGHTNIVVRKVNERPLVPGISPHFSFQ